MNNKTVFSVLFLLFSGITVAYASGFITEKDIGPCTRRSTPQGYCIESKTHTCFDIDPISGRCRGWTIKNGDQFKDINRQFEEYNQNLRKGVGATPAQKAQCKKNNIEAKTREAAIAKAENEKEAKAEAMKNSIIGNTFAIERTAEYYKKTLSGLKNKADLGVPINEAEYDLLNYKIEQLNNLELIVTDGRYANGNLSWRMTHKYEENLAAYKQKEITQEELQYLMTDLKRKDESLKAPYEEIKALTVIPIQPQQAPVQQTTEVPTANYASAQPQQSTENSNAMQSKMYNVRNGIEGVNNVTDSLNNSINTGLNLIRSLTGH